MKSARGSHGRPVGARGGGPFEACAGARRPCVGSAHYCVGIASDVETVTARPTRHAARLKAAFTGALVTDRGALSRLGGPLCQGRPLEEGGGGEGAAPARRRFRQCGESGAVRMLVVDKHRTADRHEIA